MRVAWDIMASIGHKFEFRIACANVYCDGHLFGLTLHEWD